MTSWTRCGRPRPGVAPGSESGATSRRGSELRYARTAIPGLRGPIWCLSETLPIRNGGIPGLNGNNKHARAYRRRRWRSRGENSAVARGAAHFSVGFARRKPHLPKNRSLAALPFGASEPAKTTGPTPAHRHRCSWWRRASFNQAIGQNDQENDRAGSAPAPGGGAGGSCQRSLLKAN